MCDELFLVPASIVTCENMAFARAWRVSSSKSTVGTAAAAMHGVEMLAINCVNGDK